MYYKNWYEQLDADKKAQADIIINKVKKMDANADDETSLAITCAELEDDSPALSEYRFVYFLKESLEEYDKDPENRALSLAEKGDPSIRDIVRKINEAGITGQELMTLLKFTHYEGIMETFYRFEHAYTDGLDDTEYPSFAISELGPDIGNGEEVTGRIVDVYGWLSYLNPSNE